MKELLIAEMKRALELLEAKEKPFDYGSESAELKRTLLQIRKHSVKLEKIETTPYWRRNELE